MALEQVSAEALRGYKFFPHPESKTLGILRLDTQSAQHWFLLDRKTLNLLIESLQKHVDEIAPFQ